MLASILPSNKNQILLLTEIVQIILIVMMIIIVTVTVIAIVILMVMVIVLVTNKLHGNYVKQNLLLII